MLIPSQARLPKSSDEEGFMAAIQSRKGIHLVLEKTSHSQPGSDDPRHEGPFICWRDIKEPFTLQALPARVRVFASSPPQLCMSDPMPLESLNSSSRLGPLSSSRLSKLARSSLKLATSS